MTDLASLRIRRDELSEQIERAKKCANMRQLNALTAEMRAVTLETMRAEQSAT